MTAWNGKSPLYDVLERCVTNSVKTYAIRCKATDIPLAIGGYTSVGNCWFLSSKFLPELTVTERHEFRCILMKNLLETLKLFPVLCNVAWSQNTQHLRLIQSCGGRIGTEGYGPNSELFTYFSFHREDYPHFRNM
ncbi:MAG: phage protein Gp13 family protein [Metamycoplasmataceae bacterium]